MWNFVIYRSYPNVAESSLIGKRGHAAVKREAVDAYKIRVRNLLKDPLGKQRTRS
jgi:hypothetical protein